MAKEFEVKDGIIVGESGDDAYIKGKLSYSSSRGGIYLDYDDEHRVLLGREAVAKIENVSGALIERGSIVRVDNFNTTFTIEKAIANTINDAETSFGVVCCDIPNNSTGYVYKYGSLDKLDTSQFNSGDFVYLSDTVAGAFTNIKPKAPNYAVRIGIVAISHATDGVIGIEIIPFSGTDTEVNSSGLLDGIVTPTQKVEFVIEDDVVYAEVSNQEYIDQDLPFLLGGVRYLLDTTTNTGTDGKARVALTNGLANSKPQDNYLYIELVGEVPTLSASTIAPTGDNAEIGQVSLKSIAETISDGVFSFQRTNNAVSISDGEGIIDALTSRIRRMGASYVSGVEPTIILDDTQAPDSLQLETSSGVVTQFRTQNFDAINANEYWIVNHPTEPYKKITNLNQIDVLANGDSIDDNRRLGINIFGLQSSSGITDRLLINLPLEDYGNNNSAIYDYNNYAQTSMPSDVVSRYIVFRICRLVLRYDTNGGGQWTNLLGDGSFQDERGLPLGTASGGAGSNSRTDFDDASFYWYNITDPTKIAQMNLGNLTSGATRTISMVDDDLDLANYPSKYIEFANDNLTLNTLEKYNRAYGHVSSISGFNYSDNGNATINVASGVVVFDDGVLKSFSVSAITDLSLVDGNTNYVFVDYNSGVPIINSSIIKPSERTKTILYVFSRIGTILTKVDLRFSGVNFVEKQLEADVNSFGLKHSTGCLIGETGTRNITISSGQFYLGNVSVTNDSFDSTVDTFYTSYSDGSGGWNYVGGESQINNTQYDDLSGTIATLGNNRYGVHWIYYMFDDTSAIVVSQFGQDSYTSGDVYEAEPPTEKPDIVDKYSNVILIGKIIIGKDETLFEDISSVLESGVSSVNVTDHSSLSNLDYASSGHTGFVSEIMLGDYIKAVGETRDITTTGSGSFDGDLSINGNIGDFSYLMETLDDYSKPLISMGGTYIDTYIDSSDTTSLKTQHLTNAFRILVDDSYHNFYKGSYITDGVIQHADAVQSNESATLGQVNTLISEIPSGDSTTFLGATDVLETTYVGNEDKLVKVNNLGTGTVFSGVEVDDLGNMIASSFNLNNKTITVDPNSTEDLPSYITNTITTAISICDEGDVIEIKAGTYNEYSLSIPNNVTVIGLGEVNIVGYLPASTAVATIEATSTIDFIQGGTLKNLTITAQNMRYPIHADFSNGNTIKNVQNCKFIHYGNNEAYTYNVDNSTGLENSIFRACSAWGGGTKAGDEVYIDGCYFESNIRGFSTHNFTDFDLTYGASYIKVTNSKMVSHGIDRDGSDLGIKFPVHIQSLVSNTPDKIIFENCDIGGNINYQNELTHDVYIDSENVYTTYNLAGSLLSMNDDIDSCISNPYLYAENPKEIITLKNYGANISRGKAVKKSGDGFELFTNADDNSAFYGVVLDDCDSDKVAPIKYTGLLLRPYLLGLEGVSIATDTPIYVDSTGSFTITASGNDLVCSAVENENISIENDVTVFEGFNASQLEIKRKTASGASVTKFSNISSVLGFLGFFGDETLRVYDKTFTTLMMQLSNVGNLKVNSVSTDGGANYLKTKILTGTVLDEGGFGLYFVAHGLSFSSIKYASVTFDNGSNDGVGFNGVFCRWDATDVFGHEISAEFIGYTYTVTITYTA